MQKGQIAVGIGAIILVLALYFGGKTVVKKDKPTETHAHQGITFEEYERQQISKLNENEKTQLDALSKSIQSILASDSASLKQNFTQMAAFWNSVQNPALAAYYTYKHLSIDNSALAHTQAGDELVLAYKSTEDSVILNNLITFALQSYEAAYKKDSSNIDLKLKLADAYVNGSQEPMKGIGILKELESQHPDNIKVLLSLGRMSIQSGQYDKAKERLNKILKLTPQNQEAIYFLAITEAELGHTDEAIRLFEMCKLLVNNNDFSKEIDEIINNLKK